ncbi:hypothetical protein [Halobacteriovorax sp. HLS]|uniref:hypothetical protein n=1 Tax=Halobacteriovorax sp. HLS TaxID=2234000 RepID=UPI000FD99AAC|nr:hypothetical protein [Halobacteriovorax sp. HLS]
MLRVLIVLTFLFSANTFAGICKDSGKDLGKITICHAGNDNNNPGRVNFVNICVDFASVHGHIKNHDHDSIGACGSSDLKEGLAYACNAGIKHVEPAERTCYTRSTPRISCNPNACVSGQSCDCVCSGTSGGASNVDFMTFNGRSFSDIAELDLLSQESFWDSTRQSKTSSLSMNSGSIDSEQFVVATHSPRNYVLKDKSLSFNLGTELYGTEYFVDLCWQNINEDNKGSFDLLPSYGYKNKTLFGDSYVDFANIYTRTQVYCTSDQGTEFIAFDEDYTMFPSQMQDLFPNVGSVEDVSFCRVRHYFKEDTNAFRPWELNAVEISTKLEVVLTDDQEAPEDNGLILCHPITYLDNRGREVSKVCQLEFNNSNEYEAFVLHHEDNSVGNGNGNGNQSNSSYSVNHNHDYRVISGSCGGQIASPQVCYEQMNLIEGYRHSDNLQKDFEFKKALKL